MTKKITLALYFFCLFFVSSLQAQILQHENQTIEKIDIIVHTNTGTVFDNSSTLNRLKTKQGGNFSQIEFDEDLKTLAQDFDRVEPTVDSIDGRVYITLNIWPKPIIRTIHFKGNHHIDTKRLQKELNIKHCTIYERQTFNEAFHKLKAYYIRKGYFEAELDYHVKPHCDTNEVDITIDIKEGRSGKIQDIIFVNFCDREEHEILHEMVTKKYNLLMSWYTQEGTYNQDAIQQDQLVIINYLQNQGYADAHVDISVTESCKNDRIIVTITADKGERYYFGRVSFEGNQLLCNEDLDRVFTVRPGCPFSMDKIRETVDRITEAYGRFGYIDATVDFDPELVEGEHLYDVKFKIVEGEQFRVGMIRIFGNITTKTPVILHETLLTPGEIFNSVKMKKTEERLLNTRYFKNVNVYLVKGSDSRELEGNYRDVYIEVEEMNTGHISGSIGMSTVEQIFGTLEISENNFNVAGFSHIRREGLKALRGGGEYAYAKAQIGMKSRSYILSWTKPYFLDSKWTVGFDLSNSSTRYISKTYDLENSALNLRASYNINQFLRTGVYYRLKNGYVNLSEHHHHQKALEKEASIHGLISAVGSTLTYDSTNHPIAPTKGFRSKLSVEIAGLGGDHKFISLGYSNTYFLPLGSRSVIKYRADVRFIQPVGDTHYKTLPLDERLFLGGDYTVRGFRPYRLGPQYKKAHVPRGGLSLQFYSVELDRRIMKDWEGFAFFDAGQVSREVWEFGRLYASVGYGVRFKLIESLPQITVGMGYPLNAHGNSEVKRFFISFGQGF